MTNTNLNIFQPNRFLHVLKRALFGLNSTTDEQVYLKAEHRNHFLRINNRRRLFEIDELVSAGYRCAKIVDNNTSKILWCEENLTTGSYLVCNTLWGLTYIIFACEKDFLMFQLACG